MTVYPNAKINIGLNIIRRRPDGFHELSSLMYPVPLCDTLTIQPAERPEFTIEGVPLPPDDKENLVLRAVRAVSRVRPLPPLSIRLVKQIPSGAGLGGGSADASFTITALNDMLDLGLNSREMRALAFDLGKDCPFFIDNEPAMMGGLGEQLRPSAVSLQGFRLLIVKPDVHISTAEAYRNCRPAPWAVSLSELLRQPVERWRDTVANDFEQTVFAGNERLAAIKAQLYANGAIYAAMSGSGSALFGLFAHDVSDVSITASLSEEKHFLFDL